MSTADECDCGYNGDLYLCIKGEVYGPCEQENCGGVCDPVGRCSCECHEAKRAQREDVAA